MITVMEGTQKLDNDDIYSEWRRTLIHYITLLFYITLLSLALYSTGNIILLIDAMTTQAGECSR